MLLLLKVHGCLLQAKLLLEINAQTGDTVPLLDTLLPLLQSTAPLMHPGQPCAPLRNEATLLAAAVVALPVLPRTTAMACLLRHIRQLCWQAVTHSCRDHSQDWRQWRDVHAGMERSDSMDQGCNSGGENSQDCKRVPGVNAWRGVSHSMSKGCSNVDGRGQDDKQMSDVNAGREGNDSVGGGRSRRNSGDGLVALGKNRDPVDPLQCGGADPKAPLQCDDTDPMASLWLKNATLLLFGHDLQLAVRRAVPDEEDWEACGLREEEVQTALRSRSYDVRAACLKACIQRVASGTSSAAAA